MEFLGEAEDGEEVEDCLRGEGAGDFFFLFDIIRV